MRDEKRADGPAGFFGFAISPKMSDALQAAIRKVAGAAWKPYGKVYATEIRECAESSFVPGEKSEHKDTQPPRYIAIRIRQRQENLFDDGTKVRHFAVLTNIRERKAVRLADGLESVRSLPVPVLTGTGFLTDGFPKHFSAERWPEANLVPASGWPNGSNPVPAASKTAFHGSPARRSQRALIAIERFGTAGARLTEQPHQSTLRV